MLKKGDLKSLLFFVAICSAIGVAGGLATYPQVGPWYSYLIKPPLTPPGWVFGPVWTILYVMIGVGGWRIWRRAPSDSRLKFWFVVQLALNAVWSPLFFGLQNPLAGLADITFLWLSLAILIKKSWASQKKTAGWLLPYFLWVGFALYLNAGIWWLNR